MFFCFKVRKADHEYIPPNFKKEFDEAKQRKLELLEKMKQYENSGDELNDESPGPNSGYKSSNYLNITSYWPGIVETSNGIINVISSPLLESHAFCKVGNKIFSGVLSANKTIVCQLPVLPPGEIELSVSPDRVLWSNPIVIGVVSTGFSVPWYAYMIGFIAFLVIYQFVQNRLTKIRKGKLKRQDDLLLLS